TGQHDYCAAHLSGQRADHQDPGSGVADPDHHALSTAMDRIIYTAANGANRVLDQQAVLSNHMANLGTAGFREQLSNYRSVPLVSEVGLPTRVSTVATTPGSNLEQGVMTETGRALDLAITGEGWFSVQTPDGEAF